MNFRPQDMKARLLSPRVVIYLILLIAAVWLMRRFEQYRRMETPAVVVPPDDAAPQPFHSPPDAALRAPAPRTPLLVVFTEEKDNSLTALVEESRNRLKERCGVALVQLPPGGGGMLGLKHLPVAVLYDAANRELARQEGGITAAKLDALVAKLPE